MPFGRVGVVLSPYISERFCLLFATCTQGDFKDKVSNSGGDFIDHCEIESSYELVSNSEWLPR